MWEIFSTCSQCHPLFIRIHSLIFFRSRDSESFSLHNLNLPMRWVRDFLPLLDVPKDPEFFHVQRVKSISISLRLLHRHMLPWLPSWIFPFLFHSKWSERKKFSENVFFMVWHGIFLLFVRRFFLRVDYAPLEMNRKLFKSSSITI